VPHLDRPLRTARAVSLAAAGALAIALLPAEPAVAANSIDSRFFGVHDSQPVGTGVGGWARAPVGSLRVWDAGASWREIEKTRGNFDFSRLDAIVSQARAKGSEVLLVLGQTPVFHSTNKTVPGFYGPGAAAMPNLTAWRTYVRKVVRRYGTRVKYQVWNEANVTGFWRGTPEQMALLTKVTDTVLREENRGAFLVAPAMGTRLGGMSGTGFIDRFYGTRVSGQRVAAFVDAVSLQLYPRADGSPESSMSQLRSVRGILAKHRVAKPIWNTEINYGLTGGVVNKVSYLSNSRQAAFVARTYLLNAANGVKRVYWYSWDLHSIANTRMVYSDRHTLTPAGKAFGVVRSWMVNTRMEGCSRNSRGTYTCLISYGSGKKRVYWNPSRTVYVKTAASATWWQGVGGAKHTIRGGRSLKIGSSPILVRSRR